MNKTNFSPDTHIFLWDLHDVILEKSLWSWLMVCLRFKHKTELIKKLDKKTLGIAFTFLLERLKLTKKQMVSEELIKAAHEANNHAFVDLTMQACSSYKPIKKTVAIMQELSELGYTHHLGSNIGKTVFDDCEDKFPTVFNLFKEVTIPFEREDLTIVKKPHADYFNTHITQHKLRPDQIIFIDDKLANVEAARAVGMYAIHFKNAKQLRKELVAHKILKTQ